MSKQDIVMHAIEVNNNILRTSFLLYDKLKEAESTIDVLEARIVELNERIHHLRNANSQLL